MLDFKTIHYAAMFKSLEVREPLSPLAQCIALNVHINPVVQLKFLQQLPVSTPPPQPCQQMTHHA